MSIGTSVERDLCASIRGEQTAGGVGVSDAIRRPLRATARQRPAPWRYGGLRVLREIQSRTWAEPRTTQRGNVWFMTTNRSGPSW